MCCDPAGPWPEAAVGNCPACGDPVDSDGDSTREQCSYSPKACDTCGDQPCDGSC